MNDPRKLIRIGNKVVGVEVGLPSAPLNVLIQEVTKEGDSFVSRHKDIVGSNFARGQTVLKTRDAAAAMLSKVNVTTAKIRAEKARIAEQQARATPVTSYEQKHLHVMHEDMERRANLKAMPLAKRAAVMHQLMLEPLVHLPLAEALLRTPPDLSPLSAYERAHLNASLLQALQPELYSSLDQQMEQLNTAEAVVRAAVDLVRTATGSMTEVMENAPESFKVSLSTEPPLRWVPPAPEGEEASSLAPVEATNV